MRISDWSSDVCSSDLVEDQDARVLILDEPTSALSAAEAETLFAVIAELKARGVAIVYISHRLEELKRIGDYVTVLRDGHLVATAAMADVDVRSEEHTSELQSLMRISYAVFCLKKKKVLIII